MIPRSKAKPVVGNLVKLYRLEHSGFGRREGGLRNGSGGVKQVLIVKLTTKVDVESRRADEEQNPLVISKLNCNYYNDTYDCGSYASTCYC